MYCDTHVKVRGQLDCPLFVGSGRQTPVTGTSAHSAIVLVTVYCCEETAEAFKRKHLVGDLVAASNTYPLSSQWGAW